MLPRNGRTENFSHAKPPSPQRPETLRAFAPLREPDKSFMFFSLFC
jgi:hypothetical protein